ncbi:hypothetical protein J0H58_29690 [bacterium]|nr:hypothetical protein [bacterium]
MARLQTSAYHLLAGLAVAALVGTAAAQPKDQSIKITAEALAKECAADGAKAEAKYKGKTLRVTGTVGYVYDDILYLPVRLGGGKTSDVGIHYGKGSKPAVKMGDEATFEGKFDGAKALGPALKECKLVKDGEKKK